MLLYLVSAIGDIARKDPKISWYSVEFIHDKMNKYYTIYFKHEFKNINRKFCVRKGFIETTKFEEYDLIFRDIAYMFEENKKKVS